MADLIVFDLDGTLALDEHRTHLLGPKDGRTSTHWDAYFAACRDDAPNPALVALYNTLRHNHRYRVEVWTGRVDSMIDATLDWFGEHLTHEPAGLRMREAEDRTADHDLKRQWLREARAAGDEVVMVFEDRARVVAMWRDEGITCLQVAPGDF